MTYENIKKLLNTTDDAAQKLELVMDFGMLLKPVPDDAVCMDVLGCASRVQICRKENNFYAIADSALVRGIVAILLAMVDGKTSDEIKNMDLNSEFMSLNLALGVGRVGGVNSMISFFKKL